MNTIHRTISIIATGVILLSAATAQAQEPRRALVVLSEVRQFLVTPQHYSYFREFTGNRCTRENLLASLIETGRDNIPTDILIATSPGNSNFIALKGGGSLTGETRRFVTDNLTVRVETSRGSIRSLIDDARTQVGGRFNFNIRMVVMTSDFGFTTQDDWRDLGAKSVVGCPMKNWTFQTPVAPFFSRFVQDARTLDSAAQGAMTEAKSLPQHQTDDYRFVVQSNGLTKLEETSFQIAGQRDLIQQDNLALSIGGSMSFVVKANQLNNISRIFVVAGLNYRISCDFTDEWSSGVKKSGAEGYEPQALDGGRRFASNVMCMMAEIRPINRSASRRVMEVGISETIRPQNSGFLNFFANDNPRFYFDNSGSVSVTVTRRP